MESIKEVLIRRDKLSEEEAEDARYQFNEYLEEGEMDAAITYVKNCLG